MLLGVFASRAASLPSMTIALLVLRWFKAGSFVRTISLTRSSMLRSG